MQTKFFEVRDRMTFVPIMVTKLNPENTHQDYLLGRAGYGSERDPLFLVVNLNNRVTQHNAYEWGANNRTMNQAHLYIEKVWDKLRDGDVIDIEYLLSETEEPKVSEGGGTEYGKRIAV